MKLFRKTILPIIVISTGFISAAEIYIWKDLEGIEHISAVKPNGESVKYRTVVSKNQSPSPSVSRRARLIQPISIQEKRNLPKKNIITPSASQISIQDVMVGSWSLHYEGGGSKLIYLSNGNFTYRNKNKRALFTHKGSWKIYKKRKRWYVNHRGTYFTKTNRGKTFNGKINDTYIIKRLSGRKLILLEAKNQKHISNPEYDLKYVR